MVWTVVHLDASFTRKIFRICILGFSVVAMSAPSLEKWCKKASANIQIRYSNGAILALKNKPTEFSYPVCTRHQHPCSCKVRDKWDASSWLWESSEDHKAQCEARLPPGTRQRANCSTLFRTAESCTDPRGTKPRDLDVFNKAFNLQRFATIFSNLNNSMSLWHQLTFQHLQFYLIQ